MTDADLPPGSVFIRNETRTPGLVLLCPVTRSGAEATLCWDRIISTIATSAVYALVVIDKTKTGEASKFFSRRAQSIKSRLFILRRDSSEQIFDSQKFVRLDEWLWIGQLHDDDHWEGQLRLPDAGLELNDLCLCKFALEAGERTTHPAEDHMPPARVVFSWIPAQLWNRVCDFIDAQGGHIAGSVDNTISMIALLSCRKRYVDHFTYIYSDHHWGSRREAEDHLRRLSAVDGWKEFSGSAIAIVNRTFDNISALKFFGERLSPEDVSLTYSKLVDSFKPSLRKRLLVMYRLGTLAIVIPTLSVLEWSRLPIARTAVLCRRREARSSYALNRFIVSCWRLKTPEEIVALIQRHLLPSQFPLLGRRFQFWREQIGSFNPHR